MAEQQIDPEVLEQIQQQETERFQKWQEAQSVQYLNSRVIELAAENAELRRTLTEMQSVAPQTVEAHVVE